jgi:hypothetical protein
MPYLVWQHCLAESGTSYLGGQYRSLTFIRASNLCVSSPCLIMSKKNLLKTSNFAYIHKQKSVNLKKKTYILSKQKVKTYQSTLFGKYICLGLLLS